MIAIVDDEAEVREALRQLLEIEGLVPLEFSSGEQALARLDANFAGIVIADLRMPGLDGIGLFNCLTRLDPELPVIMISGHGDIASAVDLVRRGAYDFLSKPFDADHLLATVRRALDKRTLALENRALRQPHPAAGASALLGESREMELVRLTIDQLVQADVDVLISGESGTGKSLVASLLHRRSPRARKPMISVDCRGLPGEQAESLLFGHVSGAFAGAQFPRTGQLLLANAGTLFLDHVDGLPIGLQTRLHHVVEQGSLVPIGTSQSHQTQFRTLCSTSAKLDAMTADGRFLPSLHFRLGSFRVTLPPLRDRGEDAVNLFRAFLIEESEKVGRAPPAISSAVWRRLHDHDWPGNVRELRGFAANVALGLGDPAAVPAVTQPASNGLRSAVAQFEAESIRAALARHRGDINATLVELDLPRKTLYDKLARHGIEAADFRGRKGA